MKKIFIIHYSLFILIALCATSCRPQSDDLLSYGQNDVQAFNEANNSFAGEFKAFWTAMNENYGIWDVEESFAPIGMRSIVPICLSSKNWTNVRPK